MPTNPMHILITGGTGYIGSHTAITLIEAGYKIIIADNLSNSQIDAIERIEQITAQRVDFHQIDVTDQEAVNQLFCQYRLDGVIHFAGLKAVAQSIEQPLLYYHTNLLATLTIAQACVRHQVARLVFSSSATVYGDQPSPLHETLPCLPATNPYGATKAISERILQDTAAAHPQLSVCLLRYFNPVGAHPSGLLGENPSNTPNNLMPLLIKAAQGDLAQLSIFGNNYPTADGSCIRDFIHVMDLAQGHQRALASMPSGISLYNLGTGQGTSVFQLIDTFEKTNGVKIPTQIAPRRPGDIATCYANSSKAKRELKWQATRTLADMCRDAWLFANTKLN